VGASLADGAAEGVYSIDVTAFGSYASSLTTASWDSTPDPPGNPAVYALMVGTTPHTFTTSDNSAASVAAAVNAQYGNLVHATAVNVGPAAVPDWRISLQSTTLGPMTLDIQKNGAGLQSQQQPAGALAEYEVNHSGVTVSSDTRSVTVSSGVTLKLAGTGSASVTVSRSTAALSSAVSTLADAYNAVVSELTAQHGETAGPLRGQSIVSTLSQTLSQIATYSPSSGQVTGLAGLGLSLEKDGTLTYDASKLTKADPQTVAAFLGSASGGGFLQTATNLLASLEDPTNGLLKTTESAVESQLTTLGNTISDKQEQVAQLQQQLQSQMARADALIASMQQQYSYMSSMFESMRAADQMYAQG
jgi:flagellar hook-associated protein 2